MDTTVITPKAWWASKTVQGVVIGLAASAYRVLGRRYHWADWNADDADLVAQGLQLVGLAWTAIGLRTATKPIGNPNQPVIVSNTPAGTASGEPPAGGQK